MNILEVNNLSISFRTNLGTNQVLNNVSFTVEKGKTLGIVGESGSGKSISALSILNLLPPNAVINTGEILFHKEDSVLGILSLNEREMLDFRGKNISMIFQEPMTSLNPSIKCGVQVLEMIQIHTNISKAKGEERVLELFSEVKLPDPVRIFDSYPHEISGGQKQRVMIAMAIALNPAILIADEPTTALDVTVQKSILELLKQIQVKYGISIIFISHDLGVISQIADDILVLYNGDIVEMGPAKKVLVNPDHPYTKGLLKCRPTLNSNEKRLPILSDFMRNDAGKLNKDSREIRTYTEKTGDEIILRVNHLSKKYISSKNFLGRSKKTYLAINDFNFDVYKGETLGLVGESGCGKTTLGRTIAQLIEINSGTIEYKGELLNNLSKNQLKRFRKNLQIIFQDPYSSLNPKKTIGDLIMEPLIVHRLYKNNAERREKVYEILDKVKLERSSFYKYPHEFSGGQRQRIVIARALILKPEFIICDESVSALDVSVQAEVLNLLNDLKDEFQLTYIFISHDLSVVKYMSDRIMVMKDGKLVEINKADDLYKTPASDYTRKLINAIPSMKIN